MWDEWYTDRPKTKTTNGNGASLIPAGFCPSPSITGLQAHSPAAYVNAQSGTLGNDLKDELTPGLVKASNLQGERNRDSLADVELQELTRTARANIQPRGYATVHQDSFETESSIPGRDV